MMLSTLAMPDAAEFNFEQPHLADFLGQDGVSATQSLKFWNHAQKLVTKTVHFFGLAT